MLFIFLYLNRQCHLLMELVINVVVVVIGAQFENLLSFLKMAVPPSQLIINDQPLVVIIMYYLLNLLLSDQAAWKCVWSANSSYNCYTWPFIISISFGVWSCCSRWHWATATWKTQGNICRTADNRSQNRGLKTKAKD